MFHYINSFIYSLLVAWEIRIISYSYFTDGEADSERLKLLCGVKTYTVYKKET